MNGKGRRRLVWAVVLAAVLAMSAACGHQDDPHAGPSSTAPSSSAATLPTEPSGSPDAPPPASSSSPAMASQDASAEPKVPAGAEAEASGSPAAGEKADEKGAASAAPKSSPSPEASEKPSSPSPSPSEKPKPAEQKAALSVVGNAEWGRILAPEQAAIRDGDSAGDLLIRTLKKHKLAYSTRGSGTMLYVEGIDGLFEFDEGPTSGWKFRVNGKDADVGAGSYKVKPGDDIEWYYVTEDKQAAEDGGQTP